MCTQSLFLKKRKQKDRSWGKREAWGAGGMRCWRQSSIKCPLDTYKRHFPLKGWKWEHLTGKDGSETVTKEKRTHIWIWPRHLLNMNQEVKSMLHEWNLDFNRWFRWVCSFFLFLLNCLCGLGSKSKNNS